MTFDRAVTGDSIPPYEGERAWKTGIKREAWRTERREKGLED